MTSIPLSTSPVKLVMVTADNNNKYYNMFPQGSTFLVEYGRVGNSVSQKRTYPIGKWASTYREKTGKGYKDVTDLIKTTQRNSEYKQISDPKVDKLFEMLLRFSRNSVKQNYTISSDAVTLAQINEAQSFLDEMTNLIGKDVISNFERFNKVLLELYMVIPRRMQNVKSHLLQMAKHDDLIRSARTIVDNEQKTLDVMAGQVTLQDVDESDAPEKTILDVLGIEVECGDVNDVDVVKKFMGTDAGELRAVYRVIHRNSRQSYDTFVDNASDKKSELFWHGSRNENWISILQTGLKIRPSNAVLTGAMFGHGIYFADKYRKSAGYTSLRGAYWTGGGENTAFLALMDVHVGKQLKILRHSHECYNFNKSVMQNKGNYDSVFALGGADLRNNEYIVYDDAQSTIKYLVQVGN